MKSALSFSVLSGLFHLWVFLLIYVFSLGDCICKHGFSCVLQADNCQVTVFRSDLLTTCRPPYSVISGWVHMWVSRRHLLSDLLLLLPASYLEWHVCPLNSQVECLFKLFCHFAFLFLKHFISTDCTKGFIVIFA
jgi:hypothetical protein